jgi:hypothetical protein
METTTQIPVTFTVTDDPKDDPTVVVIAWLDATSADGQVTLDMTCGAGCGNPYLKANASMGGKRVYAIANITGLAQALFSRLEAAVRGTVEALDGVADGAKPGSAERRHLAALIGEWATAEIPATMPGRDQLAAGIASRVMAGIGPYLDQAREQATP